jgi:hypothetical protein
LGELRYIGKGISVEQILGGKLVLAASIGRTSVPRLSIIIPFAGDSSRFETTLVSVLESRPRDCEILVPHDGSYEDPYQLSDEVLFIETSARSSESTLINEALKAACAPVVHVIRCGASVSEGWVEEPLQLLQSSQTSVVVPKYLERKTRSEFCGLDVANLWSHRLMPGSASATVAEKGAIGPLLASCFIKRRLMLAIDGIRDDVPLAAAESDLALSLKQLKQRVSVATSSVVEVSSDLIMVTDAESFAGIGTVLSQHDKLLGGVGKASYVPSWLERMVACLSLSRMVAVQAFTKGYRRSAGVSSLEARLSLAKRICSDLEPGVRGVVDVEDTEDSTHVISKARRDAAMRNNTVEKTRRAA